MLGLFNYRTFRVQKHEPHSFAELFAKLTDFVFNQWKDFDDFLRKMDLDKIDDICREMTLTQCFYALTTKSL